MEFGNFDGVLIRKWCDLNFKKISHLCENERALKILS